jgi:hypothetical protein
MKGKPADAPTPEIAVHALFLLGRWTRLAQGHLALASGCSCGVGFGAVRVQDFEQDILDYLHAKHGAESRVDALLRERGGYRRGEAGSIAELLRAFAKDGAIREDIQAALLADIERSIESFGELHRGQRSK